MPQELQVLRCYSCQTFQVHIVKKINKWECKICGEKQSQKQVYGRGSGKDCRLHVQRLNELRLKQHETQEHFVENKTLELHKQWVEVPSSGFQSDASSNGSIKQHGKGIGKWTEFLEETSEISDDDGDNLPTFLPFNTCHEFKKKKQKTFHGYKDAFINRTGSTPCLGESNTQDDYYDVKIIETQSPNYFKYNTSYDDKLMIIPTKGNIEQPDNAGSVATFKQSLQGFTKPFGQTNFVGDPSVGTGGQHREEQSWCQESDTGLRNLPIMFGQHNIISANSKTAKHEQTNDPELLNKEIMLSYEAGTNKQMGTGSYLKHLEEFHQEKELDFKLSSHRNKTMQKSTMKHLSERSSNTHNERKIITDIFINNDDVDLDTILEL